MRLNPILSSVPYYANIIDPNMNSIDSKKIRNSFLTFRTSSKPGSVEGINADFVSLDEYDRVPAQSVQSAENSMSSSNFHIFRRWSTPTAPNIGIHDLFVHSDQMEYMHKCAHCGYWNLMSYDDYIEGSPDKGGNILLMNPDGIDPKGRTVQPGTFQYVCRKCGKPLDRWYNGSWVQQYPSRTQGMTGTRGYHISQLNAVWVNTRAQTFGYGQ